MNWNELTARIKEFEAEQAPGTETTLWGAYVNHTIETLGCSPWAEDDKLDAECPTGEAEWWLQAYPLQARLDNLPPDTAAELFDGDWGTSLDGLNADIERAENSLTA